MQITALEIKQEQIRGMFEGVTTDASIRETAARAEQTFGAELVEQVIATKYPAYHKQDELVIDGVAGLGANVKRLFAWKEYTKTLSRSHRAVAACFETWILTCGPKQEFFHSYSNFVKESGYCRAVVAAAIRQMKLDKAIVVTGESKLPGTEIVTGSNFLACSKAFYKRWTNAK